MIDNWDELIIKTEYENWTKLEEFLYKNELYSFEMIDPRLENIKNDKGRWDFIEDNIFEDSFNGITIKLYSSNDEIDLYFIKEKIENLNLGSTEISVINDEDWKNNWKSFYSAQKIGKKLLIKPTWEEYDNIDERVIINLDPGMAFGTGGHETTKMSLEYIEKYLTFGDDVIDIGCGSGILSIASKLLGAENVLGADLDLKAVEISKANANLNKVNVKFIQSDLFSKINAKGNLIIANIVAEVLLDLINELDNYLHSKGIFICSGIIIEKSNLVEAELIKNGYEIIDKSQENGWVCLVARRKDA